MIGPRQSRNYPQTSSLKKNGEMVLSNTFGVQPWRNWCWRVCFRILNEVCGSWLCDHSTSFLGFSRYLLVWDCRQTGVHPSCPYRNVAGAIMPQSYLPGESLPQSCPNHTSQERVCPNHAPIMPPRRESAPIMPQSYLPGDNHAPIMPPRRESAPIMPQSYLPGESLPQSCPNHTSQDAVLPQSCPNHMPVGRQFCPNHAQIISIRGVIFTTNKKKFVFFCKNVF
jgi:hypothetical protein